MNEQENDYTVYRGEVDIAWLRERIDHAMANCSDLVMDARQVAELCLAMEEAEAAKESVARADRLNAKLEHVHDALYGKGFEVANHHLNGALEPLDNWFDENDWEPEDSAESGARLHRYSASERIEALQWVLDNSASYKDLAVTIERLDSIAKGARPPCRCMGIMCRGCPDCQGIVRLES